MPLIRIQLVVAGSLLEDSLESKYSPGHVLLVFILFCSGYMQCLVQCIIFYISCGMVQGSESCLTTAFPKVPFQFSSVLSMAKKGAKKAAAAAPAPKAMKAMKAKKA